MSCHSPKFWPGHYRRGGDDVPGHYLVPIKEGAFRKEDVVAEMTEMCQGKAELRTNDKEITVFKAIGQALPRTWSVSTWAKARGR